jgi:PilZ domain-containing protein
MNGANAMRQDNGEQKINPTADLMTDVASPCGPAPEVQERRKLRRAKLSLWARVRPGDLDYEAFEEVAATLNASRKAFYFQTKSDRYHAGMQLRVSFPYEPSASAGAPDDVGDVVRVDKLHGGYGVAVEFWKPSVAGTASAQRESVQEPRRGNAERRCHVREPLVAAIEIFDEPTGMKMRANTSDVSAGGCYVNTLNPFRLGSTLGVKIEHANVTLEAEAEVRTRFDGSGMGLAFRNVSVVQLAILSDWLRSTKTEPAACTI